MVPLIIERDRFDLYFYYLYDFHKLKSTRNFPLYNYLQSKNKSNGKIH